MFTPAERDHLCDGLVAAARDDPRIMGVAWFGSTASGARDEWSDVDLMFAVADAQAMPEVLEDWTVSMYRDHGAVHHVDVIAGQTVYRVFLLTSTLQVDVAFAPAYEFGAVTPAFRLIFGSAAERPQVQPPSADHLAGMAWLHALHARSAIARGRRWQAEYMISGVRDHGLALACLRHGLPAVQGRGVDGLPAEALRRWAGALVGSVDDRELRRALHAVIEALLSEIERSDATLANGLAAPLRELAGFGEPGA